MFEYRIEVWWTEKKRLVNKPVSFQNLGLKSILGAIRTTLIAAIEVEAVILCTTIRVNHIYKRYVMRVVTLPASYPLRN